MKDFPARMQIRAVWVSGMMRRTQDGSFTFVPSPDDPNSRLANYE